MKKALSIAIACILATHQAHATYVHKFNEKNMYARVYSGTGWAEKTQLKYPTDDKLTIQYHPNITGGFNFGYRHEHWRVEAEYDYLKNKHKYFKYNQTRIAEQGTAQIKAAMINLAYDFADEYYATIPYFGAGIGTAHVKVSGYRHNWNGTVGGGASEDELAWQGFVGIGYYLTKNWLVDIVYRHFATAEADRTFDDEYHANLLNLGVTFHFT